ncbi:MAG: GNAT family N-acetyltransferase, partial [Pollutimonas bauzanensis]
MHELARTQPETGRSAGWPQPTAGGLALGLARSNEELEAIQRLRYQVFTEEMNAVFPDTAEGLDSDRYDAWCEHLMVQEIDTGRVVGTYRLLSPANAKSAGGYYSESEFDLAGLGDLRREIVEIGRSCTHADYRNGAVIMLLWSGIASVVRQLDLRYVLGCA